MEERRRHLDLGELARHARATECVVRLHEQRCPARQQAILQAVQPPPAHLPFDNRRIHPDTVVTIAQRMSTEGLTLYEAAEEYGQPIELLEMELAALKGRYRKELLRRAGWHRPEHRDWANWQETPAFSFLLRVATLVML